MPRVPRRIPWSPTWERRTIRRSSTTSRVEGGRDRMDRRSFQGREGRDRRCSEESVSRADWWRRSLVDVPRARMDGRGRRRNSMQLILSVLVARALLAGCAVPPGKVPWEGNSLELRPAEPPVSFDSREAWFGCGATVLDQGQCGSCWAVSATGVLADRWCVHKTSKNSTVALAKGPDIGRAFERGGSCREATSGRHGCTRVAQSPSPMTLMACCSASSDWKVDSQDEWHGLGCGGGDPDEAWKFLTEVGSTPMTIQPDANYGGCTPYTSGVCLTDPRGNGCRTCQSVVAECQDTGARPEFYRMDRYGQVLVPGQKRTTFGGEDCTGRSGNPEQVLAIQTEIMTNGPVHACYTVLSDFIDFFNQYPGGVYDSKLSERVQKVGGHCIKLIGWGTDPRSGLDYWLVQNTWSENWGTAGVFRYVRGKDLCGIESDVWTACPEGSEETCVFTRHVIPDPGRNKTLLSSIPSGSYGGGKWLKVETDHPLVRRATSHLLGELSLEEPPPLAGTYTQVANGIRVRLDLDVQREALLLGARTPPATYVYHEPFDSSPRLDVLDRS